MLFAFIFVSNRFSQIVLLTPIVGMLGWFVEKFNHHNALTPDAVVVLFIVATLALVWSILTLFAYHRSSHNALLVSLIDSLFIGAFIGSVWALRGIRHADCEHPSERRLWTNHIAGVNDAGIAWGARKPCAMLKASWAFAILNTMLFVLTAFAAYLHGDHKSPAPAPSMYTESVARSSRRSDRRSHRHRSRSAASPHSRRSQRTWD